MLKKMVNIIHQNKRIKSRVFKKRWCKLSLPKWKTAVDKLVAGCRTLREIVAFIPPVVTADDPVEPIPVSPKNTDIANTANTTNPDSVDPNTNLGSLPG